MLAIRTLQRKNVYRSALPFTQEPHEGCDYDLNPFIHGRFRRVEVQVNEFLERQALASYRLMWWVTNTVQ